MSTQANPSPSLQSCHDCLIARGARSDSSAVACRTAVCVGAATFDDIPELARLKAGVAREAYAEQFDARALDRWVASNCSPEHYRYRIGRSGYDVLVARDSTGAIVGVATLRMRGARGDLSGLYVRDRGRGIGRALSQARERLARSHGAQALRASVFRSNEAAQRFVKALGFERTRGYREPTLGVMVDHYERPLR